MPLTDTQIRNTKTEAKAIQLVDGFGLYLEIRPTGARFWRMRFWLDGKDSRMTIGRYPVMGLKEARVERDRIRKMIADGISPTAEKKARRALRIKQQGDTFQTIADEWLDRKQAKWSPYYRKQAEACLRNNAHPFIGDMPMRQITSAHILSIMQQMEERGAHTFAIQLRQWISAIFRHAIVTLRADTDPAAALKGAIERPQVVHSRALPVEEIRRLRDSLESYGGNRTTVLAMKLMLYTFVRTAEARMARWDEFDGTIWLIPAGRMKMRRAHLVPLSIQAQAVIEEVRGITGSGEWLFPNTRRPRLCMSATTINRALEYMGFATGEVTGHDFRATASTHLNELGYHADLIERQLAHVDRNTVRRSYNHAQYLEERTAMMQEWSNWIDRC